MVWLMMMGCPKDLLIPIVAVLGLIEGFAAGLEDGSSIFLIIFLVIGAIIYFLVKDDSKQPSKSVQTTSTNNVTSTKPAEQKVIQKINTDDKIRLNSLLEQIKNANSLDETRAIDLYEIGFLYEKLYGDYFRSTAFVYLAMNLAKNNKSFIETPGFMTDLPLNMPSIPHFATYILDSPESENLTFATLSNSVLTGAGQSTETVTLDLSSINSLLIA